METGITSQRALWKSAVFAAAVVAFACGGSEKKTSDPDDVTLSDSEPDDEPAPMMVPPEKYDEINQVFHRRQTKASRCFADAIEDGKLDKNAQGEVTLEMQITTAGRARDVKVVHSTLKSQPVHECLIDAVHTWRFTTLPEPVVVSYTYKFERDY